MMEYSHKHTYITNLVLLLLDLVTKYSCSLNSSEDKEQAKYYISVLLSNHENPNEEGDYDKLMDNNKNIIPLIVQAGNYIDNAGHITSHAYFTLEAIICCAKEKLQTLEN